MRTVREECLDHLLVHSRRHLESVLAAYVEHYSRARPHRWRQLATPLTRHEMSNGREIGGRDILAGIIRRYHRTA